MIWIQDLVVLGIVARNVGVEHQHIVSFVVPLFVKVNNFAIYLFTLHIVCIINLITVIDSTLGWKPI